METSVDSARYGLAARLIHWIMAAGFAFMWACGYAMTTLVEEDSALEELLFSLHISIGVSLLVLLVARIGVRLANRPPPLPAGIRPAERVGAHLAHAALYALPAAVIAVGWFEVDAGGHGASWFGVGMPKVFPIMETLAGYEVEDTAETVHRWLAYAMLGVAAAHVAAVGKHRWIDRHDVLRRMNGRRAPGTPGLASGAGGAKDSVPAVQGREPDADAGAPRSRRLSVGKACVDAAAACG